MSEDRFVWLDIETFGLDAESDPIIEIGFRITDADLNDVSASSTMSVIVWDELLHERAFERLEARANKGDKTANYILEMHFNNYLFAQARENGMPYHQAVNEVTVWLDAHEVKGSDPMCGSSVQFDRAFLTAQMPEIAERFHYRNIDISTVKELCRRKNSDMFQHMESDCGFEPGGSAHRVIPDLSDTIREAKWYFDNFLFIPGSN